MSVRDKATQAVTQLMSLNALMWLTMLTCLAGVLFLATAIYLTIAAVAAPALAALVAGLALLVLFVLQVALIRWATRPAPDRGAAQPAESRTDRTAESSPGPVNTKGLADWSRNNADVATAGALVVGIALAASPGLRHFVVRAAGPVVIRKCSRLLRDFTQ